MLRQLQLVDRFYGIAAGLVIVTGIALVLYGLKGPTFYLWPSLSSFRFALR
jgi:uncharacterized membrane protein